jgi:hypothetical protein
VVARRLHVGVRVGGADCNARVGRHPSAVALLAIAPGHDPRLPGQPARWQVGRGTHQGGPMGIIGILVALILVIILLRLIE